MKHLRYFLIGCVAIISLSSNMTRITQPSEGIYPGDLFPSIEKLTSLGNVVEMDTNLSNLKGQKVLVVFWAAYNAHSRMENVLLSHTIEQQNYPVQLISVSLDKSKAVFEKTIATDKIDAKQQFWANGTERSDLLSLYQLSKEFKNYLIDEQGKIIAMNVTPANLDLLLKEK